MTCPQCGNNVPTAVERTYLNAELFDVEVILEHLYNPSTTEVSLRVLCPGSGHVVAETMVE